MENRKESNFIGILNKYLLIIIFIMCFVVFICRLTYFNIIVKYILSIIGIIYIWSFYNRKDVFENIKALLFSFLIAFTYTIGNQIEYFNEINISIKTIFTIINLFILSFPLISYLLNEKTKINIINKKVEEKYLKYAFIFIYIVELILFLMILPGHYGYDAGFEIMQILNKDMPITSMFSLTYSASLGFWVFLGKCLFHKYEYGLAIFLFLQFNLILFILFKLIRYIYEKTNKSILSILICFLFVTNIYFKILIISTSQDVIYGGLFALIAFWLLKNDEIKEKNNTKRYIILGVFISLLFELARNNGFHVILFTTMMLFITGAITNNLKLYKFVFIVFIISMVLYKIIDGPIYRHFNIKNPVKTREMMSVPAQQLARSYVKNINNLSKYEKQEYEYFFKDIDKFNIYLINQKISDAQKDNLNTENILQDKHRFIRFYLYEFKENPKLYFDAFFINTQGFWYLNKRYYDSQMYHPLVEIDMLKAKEYNSKYIDMKRMPISSKYEKFIKFRVKTNNIILKPFKIVNSMAFGFFLYILVLIKVLLAKTRKYYGFIFMVLGQYIVLFLSPVTLYRYYFPVLMVVPFMLLIFFESTTLGKKRKKNLKK